MPKLVCKCNNVINFSGIPCEHQWLFMSDVEYDYYSGKIDTDDLYNKFKMFLKCDNCGRLWVFWESDQPTLYTPESPTKD